MFKIAAMKGRASKEEMSEEMSYEKRGQGDFDDINEKSNLLSMQIWKKWLKNTNAEKKSVESIITLTLLFTIIVRNHMKANFLWVLSIMGNYLKVLQKIEVDQGSRRLMQRIKFRYNP